MPYADGRAILDADSHLMELPGFLEPYMEPAWSRSSVAAR